MGYFKQLFGGDGQSSLVNQLAAALEKSKGEYAYDFREAMSEDGYPDKADVERAGELRVQVMQQGPPVIPHLRAAMQRVRHANARATLTSMIRALEKQAAKQDTPAPTTPTSQVQPLTANTTTSAPPHTDAVNVFLEALKRSGGEYHFDFREAEASKNYPDEALVKATERQFDAIVDLGMAVLPALQAAKAVHARGAAAQALNAMIGNINARQKEQERPKLDVPDEQIQQVAAAIGAGVPHDKAARAAIIEQGAAMIPAMVVARYKLPGSPFVVGKIDEMITEISAEQAVPALMDLLYSNDTKAVPYVIQYLGELQATEAVEPLLTILTESSRRHYRAMCITALGNIGDPRALDALYAIAEKGEELQSNTLAALLKFDDPRVKPLLISRAHTEDNIERAVVARGLAPYVHEPDVQAILMDIARDRTKGVHRPAILALGGAATAGSDLLAFIIELMQDVYRPERPLADGPIRQAARESLDANTAVNDDPRLLEFLLENVEATKATQPLRAYASKLTQIGGYKALEALQNLQARPNLDRSIAANLDVWIADVQKRLEA